MMWFPRVHHDRLPAAVSNLEPSEDRVSHEQTPYNAQDVDPELILPKLPSLIIMIAANIFLQVREEYTEYCCGLKWIKDHRVTRSPSTS